MPPSWSFLSPSMHYIGSSSCCSRVSADGKKAEAPSEPRSLVRSLVVMGLVVLLGLAPILANMLPDIRAEGDFLVEGGGFADIYSADLAGYALPTQLHPLLGGIARRVEQLPAPARRQPMAGQQRTAPYIGLAGADAGAAGAVEPSANARMPGSGLRRRCCFFC